MFYPSSTLDNVTPVPSPNPITTHFAYPLTNNDGHATTVTNPPPFWSLPLPHNPAYMRPNEETKRLLESLVPIPSPNTLSTTTASMPANMQLPRPMPIPDAVMKPESPSDELRMPCTICGDKATGKHYGAISCDGCKGFFRRTIRKNQNYHCRFQRTCLIDKAKRNSCRYCRFKKCMAGGMKRQAVQNERDPILSRKSPSGGNIQSGASDTSVLHVPIINNTDFLDILLRAEGICNQFRSSVITKLANPKTAPISPVDTNNEIILVDDSTNNNDKTTPKQPTKSAAMADVTESMHHQLLVMVEWAKTLPQFYQLPLDDQIALLRHYAAQHLVISVAYHSLEEQAFLLLTNGTYITRDSTDKLHDVHHVTIRIFDELLRPMQRLYLTEPEYASLKAIAFFNPVANNLSDECKVHVEETRQLALVALQQHLNHDGHLRFAQLLLLLPSLQAIAQNLVENLQLLQIFGMEQIDSLLQELLLPSSTASTSLMPSFSNNIQNAEPEAIQDINEGFYCGFGPSSVFFGPYDSTDLNTPNTNTIL